MIKSIEQLLIFWDNELRASTELLAKSSAFAFFPENALIGRVSGNAGKSTKSFVGALNHFWPVKGFKWDVDPVVTKDSVARFEKELKGLNSFSASFSTRPMLDPTDEIAGDVGAFYKEWAEMAGADFDVEIKVTLAGNNMYERARRKFKEVAGDFIKSAADQGVRAKVSGVDLADKLLELNLVSHPVVEQSEITISHGESRQFTGLIDHLVSVCVQKESYLYELSRNEQ